MENAASITPDGKARERLYSLCHLELALLAGASLSYRKGLEPLNRLLRRGAEEGLKLRTYLDLSPVSKFLSAHSLLKKRMVRAKMNRVRIFCRFGRRPPKPSKIQPQF